MRAPFLAFVFLIFTATICEAQQFQTGQQVRLVEREINIPVHPAPGNSTVPFRFVSGTLATVLSIDGVTGWVELRGKALNITEPKTGWVTPGFIAAVQPAIAPVTEPGTTGWCPAKGTSAPHPSGRLRIATWNLENLHSKDGQSIFEGTDPSVKRFPADYDRMKCYIRLFDPDILAVQEVDGSEALSRVVDSDVYTVHVSSRPQGAGLNGKQNTGFAYKKGLSVQQQPDFKELDVSGGSLRYGTRIDLNHNGKTIQLMSVHLKSGCFENSITSSACTKLMEQVPILENWMDTAANGPVPFIVLGDFNRRFNLPGDTVWVELDDANPPNADLETITKDMPVSCRDNQFTSFIDHIVFDKRAWAWADRSSFRQITYRQEDKEKWDKLSDHCPVMVELWVK